MSPGTGGRRKGRAELRVAVVGATGIVGKVLLELLEKRRFPIAELLPFCSGRRAAAVRFRGHSLPAPGVSKRRLFSADLAFLVSSDAVSKRYGRELARAGIWVIDDSSAFRMHEDVPLVIPEVNAQALKPGKRLIAGPNCTVTGAAVAGYPLLRKAGVSAVRLASYQAVSGAGRDALREFYGQVRRAGRALKSGGLLPRPPRQAARVLPAPIAFNLFPQVGAFDARGDSGEEAKIRAELRKLWSQPGLKVSSTAVRIPVIRSHSLALWVETSRPLTPAAARRLLRRAPGVRLWPEPSYPTALTAAGTEPVHVGRIRMSGAAANELSLWVVSDNLVRGAALNSIHIAERLLKNGWLNSRGAIS